MKNRTNTTFGTIAACALLLTSCGASVPDVNVSNLKLAQSEANANLSNLSFDFDTDAGTYSCIVAGIKDAGMTDEEGTAIAKNVGGNFSIGKPARIDAGESYDLIDAEKYGGKNNESVSSGKPYGDANLCWAASVADMLVHSGWSDETSMEGASGASAVEASGASPVEDGILSWFTEEYFDDGAFQETGIKFWFNGVNKDQVCAEKAGKDGAKDAVFVDNEDNGGDVFSSTQVRHPGTDGDKLVNKGQATDVAAEAVYEKTYASNKSDSEMADYITKAIDEGDAVGIQLLFYNGESRVGVHAITVFGYVKDARGKLAGLIVSDSDNDMDWSKAYGDSADATYPDRASAPNSYDMFLTDSFTHNETSYIELKDYKYSNSKLKYTNSVIHGVTILKPRSTCNDTKDAGTCDAVNTPDITCGSAEFSEEQVDFEVKAGEKVKIPFIVYNSSYKGYSAIDKPVAKCRFIVYKDGNKVGETGFDAAMVTESYTTGEANCGFSVTNPYTFNEAGNYEIDVEILGVYSGVDNHKLAEAYFGNNYVKSAARVTVK